MNLKYTFINQVEKSIVKMRMVGKPAGLLGIICIMY